MTKSAFSSINRFIASILAFLLFFNVTLSASAQILTKPKVDDIKPLSGAKRLVIQTTSLSNAFTPVGGIISQNTTWSVANSPYVVTSNVTVNSGVTLTIEPGVVVKFQPQTSLIVNGTLITNGTLDNKIVFTSYKDDSFAGDTNQDGALTLPAKADWGQIRFYWHGN